VIYLQRYENNLVTESGLGGSLDDKNGFVCRGSAKAAFSGISKMAGVGKTSAGAQMFL
jgi:hypothetical protein